jgi:hypothetical protein
MNEVVLIAGGFEIRSPAGRKAYLRGEMTTLMLAKHATIKERNEQAADYYLEGICDAIIHGAITGGRVGVEP